MTLWERGGDGLRELDPVQPNYGFTERQRTTLVGPDDHECQLLVDDETTQRDRERSE